MCHLRASINAGFEPPAIIYRSKADPFGEGRIAFTSRRTASLVRDLLGWRGPHIAFLFCPNYQGKAKQRSLIRLLIKRFAEKADLDTQEVHGFSGQPLRVAAIQDQLCAGHDTAAIMLAGCWKSINILSRHLEHAEKNVWA